MARAPELTRQASAFLDMIAWSEGTSTSAISKDDGYDIIVTGIDKRLERFSDYSAHPFAGGRPSKQINNRGLYSTASGRYQDILPTWRRAASALGLRDFSPVSQDRANWWLIQQRKADVLIERGMIEAAIALLRVEWASLPGANAPGQPMRRMTQCLAMFELKGGSWNSSVA